MHHNDEPEDAAEANNVEMVVDVMEWPLPTTTLSYHCDCDCICSFVGGWRRKFRHKYRPAYHSPVFLTYHQAPIKQQTAMNNDGNGMANILYIASAVSCVQ